MLPLAPVSRRESASSVPDEPNSLARVPVVLTSRRTIWLVMSETRYWPVARSTAGVSLSATANISAWVASADSSASIRFSLYSSR